MAYIDRQAASVSGENHPDKPAIRFLIGDEDEGTKNMNMESETMDDGDAKAKGRSRFTVAKVDRANDPVSPRKSLAEVPEGGERAATAPGVAGKPVPPAAVNGFLNGHGSEPEPLLRKSESQPRFRVAKVEFADDPVSSRKSPPHTPAVSPMQPVDQPPDGGGLTNGYPPEPDPLLPGGSAGGQPPAPSAQPLQGNSVTSPPPKISRPPRLNEVVNTNATPEPACSNMRDSFSSSSPPYSPNMSDSYQTQGTSNLKTFGRNTLETLPHMDHYRNLLSATGAMRKRPTLLELHDQDEDDQHLLQDAENGHVPTKQGGVGPVEEVKPPSAAPKFGWINGVLVRCLLNIYGVMLFLRLSWVVGQAGTGLGAGIILLSTVVTTLTALSMSAICTNGEVKGGGAYYMISRSLGPEFGGAIGLIFSVANAVAVAMYTVGFAETIRDILKNHDCLMVDETNDVRIIGSITVLVLLSVALIGMEWEARAQVFLLGILTIAIVNFIIGTFIPPTELKHAKGFVGYRADVFRANLGPDFRDGEGFFTVFSVFFPAATGILAGANISGDLQNPSQSIPRGTLTAILITTITYIAMGWMSGSCVLRDAFGPIASELNVSMVNSSFAESTTGSIIHAVEYAASNDTCLPGECKYGLHNDMQVMQIASAYGPISIAGIISATLSSALASLVSAPKVFQAVCKDKIFPGIHFFARGYGKGEEPRRGYLLTTVIGIGFVCIGDLNAIAPLISNFFLMSYALINYSCFDASLAKSPGWRPAFRYYSMWLSLVGALLCLAVMFIINWWMALVTFVCVAALYIYVHYRKPDINWGSSTQAHVYRSALQHTFKLVSVLEHVKNFRPQVLVLTAFPRDRQILVDFASCITKNISLLVCGNIILGDPSEKLKDVRTSSQAAYTWLGKRKIKGFYSAVTAQSLRTGCQALLQCSGMGKMKPNTLIVGFKNNWHQSGPQDVEDYVNIIHDAFDLHYGVGILRIDGGLDFSNLSTTDESPTTEKSGEAEVILGKEEDSEGDGEVEKEEEEEESEEKSAKADVINKEVLKNLNQFHRKQKRGFIDVWWLFDDGGLTLLIPYILSNKSQWENCKLRVFMAGTKNKQMELDRDKRHMATLLNKFRIEYSAMTVIPDIGKKPEQKRLDDFDTLIEPWLLREEKGETQENHPSKISIVDLSAQRDKTYRHLRMQELLQRNSSDASLIVVTLPMPKKCLVSPALYMAWIDTMTKDLPPVLLLRGNQDSVLTYYS